MPDLKLGFAMLNPTYRASLGRNYDRRLLFIAFARSSDFLHCSSLKPFFRPPAFVFLPETGARQALPPVAASGRTLQSGGRRMRRPLFSRPPAGMLVS